jgi:hypothetical protein
MVKAKKLPSGRWRARVQIESGRGSQKYETFIADTEDEANFMALEYELKNQHKTKVDMTFAEAIDKYIESKTPLLSPSTIDTYKKLKRNYFIDIQNKRIRDITQEDIQKEINK